ncbi:MAG: hypothetical protein ACXVGB_13655 [Mycobacteriaceae bacterium]
MRGAAMVTLDMVPLRSMMPPTGRVTLRYAFPTITIDVPADDRTAPTTTPRIATTPQVEADGPVDGSVDDTAGADLETTAGKGGTAR